MKDMMGFYPLIFVFLEISGDFIERDLGSDPLSGLSRLLPQESP